MEAAHSEEVIRAGQLEIRPADALVLGGGRPLTLSVREFGVLVALARRVPRIVSREELYALVWERPLRDGDRIRIGTVEMTFRCYVGGISTESVRSR